MGKKKIEKMARALLADSEHGQAALLELVRSRHFDRDALLLIDILKKYIKKKGYADYGAFLLFCVIQEIAKEAATNAIADLLFMSEIYVRQDRSLRGRLLEVLGTIGNCQTAEKIREAAPLFEGIKYTKIDGVDSPKRRRKHDMEEIKIAIQGIAMRKGC